MIAYRAHVYGESKLPNKSFSRFGLLEVYAFRLIYAG